MLKSFIFKPLLLIPLILALLTPSVPMHAASISIPNHWAADVMKRWTDRGWLTSQDVKTINNPTTRAEWVHWMNQAFKFTDGPSTGFKDVKPYTKLAYETAAAVAAAYIEGFPDNTFKPHQKVTRQEAAIMMTRLFGLRTDLMPTGYKDVAAMGEWSKGAIAAVTEQGLLAGNNGRFNPKAPITKAEAISFIDRALTKKTIEYKRSGTYGNDKKRALVPNDVSLLAADIIVQNISFREDLIIDATVSSGSITLSNVAVQGTLIVKGGSLRGIQLIDSEISKMTVNKSTNDAVISLKGSTKAGTVKLESGGSIDMTSSSGVNAVSIASTMSPAAPVRLSGSIASVNIITPNRNVQLTNSKIDLLNVAKAASNASISLGDSGSITNLIANDSLKLTGPGNLQSAIINASNVSLDQSPISVTAGAELSQNATLLIAGNETSPSAYSLAQPPIVMGVVESMNYGESMSIVSSKNGMLYVVPLDTPLDLNAIHLAGSYIEPLEALVPYTLDANSFTEKKWRIVVIDSFNQISEPKHFTILNFEKAPLKMIWASNNENRTLAVSFNKHIVNALPSIDELKQAITVSADGGASFRPLGIKDNVSFERANLNIELSGGVHGNENVVRLAEGAVKSKDGLFKNNALETWKIAAGVRLSLLSWNFLKIGEDLHFKVDRPVDVYFTNVKDIGKYKTYEESAAAGLSLKISVSENEVGKQLTIPTAGLNKGDYELTTLFFNAESYHISLSDVSFVAYYNVYNLPGLDNDYITVSGISPGNTVTFYADKDKKQLIGQQTGTSSSGKAMIKFQLPLEDLISEPKTIYITLSTSGGYESEVIPIVYKRANSPPVPKDFDKKIVLSLATGTSATILASELATDPDGDVLRISSIGSQLNEIVQYTFKYNINANRSDGIVITAGKQSGHVNVTVTVSDPENHQIEVVIPVTVEK
ncbi:MAG: S-layer homology domain-containing protein [Bacillota bacterium]